MTDAQLLTLAIDIVVPLSLLLYSISRITDRKDTFRAEIGETKETLCWKNREPYNEARYVEALRRHAPKAEENAKKTTLDLQWKSCGGFSKLV